MVENSSDFPRSKYKGTASGVADYNMGAFFYQKISDYIGILFTCGSNAEATLRPRYIIDYYSNLRQLYILISPFITPTTQEKIEDDFNYVRTNLDIVNRNYKTDPKELVSILQNVHIKLYEYMQMKRMFIPTSKAFTTMGDIERKLGVRAERI